MSNCHVRELSKAFVALFKDAAEAYPTLKMEFERDLTRLEAAVEARGIRVYLEDLPAIGKHLDRCLADGQYNPSGLPLTKRVSKGVVIPKFLRGLYLLVFDGGGLLKDDCDVQAVFFLRQLTLFAKKAVYDAGFDKVEEAVLEFVEVDCELPEPESFWSSSDGSRRTVGEVYGGFRRSDLLRGRVSALPLREQRRMSTYLANLDVTSILVTSALGRYQPAEWRFRHGPGAISECVGPSNKYCWENWSDRLESEYPIADFGFHSHAAWADRAERGDIGSQNPSSRLVAVPKTFSGPRLIAAEPSEHQWCQQNSWHYFRARTKASWLSLFLDFQDQTKNQTLCTRGSETGSLATVDLKSASDRITCHLVGQYFRGNPELLSCLRASRTHSVKQKLSPKAPAELVLKKFSTMGSANTFPIQSLIFLGLALTAVLTTRRLPVNRKEICKLEGEVAVFGDDIVVPVDSRELLVEALEVCYLRVNQRKSFWTGMFRESCGVDSFRGVNVTPAYWKRFYDGGPESLASVTETANNLYGKWLLHASEQLASTLPRHVPTVAMGSGIGGLKSRCPVVNPGLKARYNHDLQRDEVLALTTSSSQDRTPTNDDTALLQYFTEEPEPLTKWTHGVAQRPRLRKKLRWVCTNQITAQ